MRISHIGTNQRVIVICVKWRGRTTTRLSTCADWVALLNRQANDYFNQATFNQTNFLFEAPSGAGLPTEGWFQLPYDTSGSDYRITGQDAINLADPYVDFTQYNRVLVINNLPEFGGQGASFNAWEVQEGGELTLMTGGRMVRARIMSLAHINEWQAHSNGRPYDEAVAVAIHELGHQLELPTHYGTVRWASRTDSISPWDVMGLSPQQTHFLGRAKAERAWLSERRVVTIGPPTRTSIDQTITLQPLEQMFTRGTQLIKIPFIASAALNGYVLENRLRVNGDDEVPVEGVLVSLVDENALYGTRDVVAQQRGDVVMRMDDVYVDSSHGLRISVVGQSRNNYDVRIQYDNPPAGTQDLMIEDWGAPPYETRDIWIDSEANGWGRYRYMDSAGNPIGNGDDAWVNHWNRVYVRLRNLGTRVANNVRVHVYVNSPPGMGDRGANWDPLGTIVFSSVPPGGTPVQDYLLWKPMVAAHTCIKAEIENLPGELSATNNRAQENVATFETTTGSPWKPVGLQIRVNNPSEHQQTPVHFRVHDVPEGWAVMVEPNRMTLSPGGYDWVTFMAFPSGAPGEYPEGKNPFEQKYKPGFIGKPKIEALVPYADTFVSIGGVDLWTHLVRPTALTIDVQGAKGKLAVRGQLKPAVSRATIAVELTHRKKSEIRHVSTNKKGLFELSHNNLSRGNYHVQAFFAGDMVHAKAESDVIKVNLTSKK